MTDRTVLLVRHGQFEHDGPELEWGPRLTKLGRRQAIATGTFLGALPIQRFFSSPLNRARETANLIASRIPGTKILQSPLLQEVIPTPVPGVRVRNVRQHRRMADEAFEHFFGPPARVNRFDCLICHGNLIRYLICRALGASAATWLKLDVCRHCAVSEFRIDQNGRILLCSYNGVHHLPPKLRTV